MNRFNDQSLTNLQNSPKMQKTEGDDFQGVMGPRNNKSVNMTDTTRNPNLEDFVNKGLFM